MVHADGNVPTCDSSPVAWIHFCPCRCKVQELDLGAHTCGSKRGSHVTPWLLGHNGKQPAAAPSVIGL
jgi:hypothetical protein